MNFKNKIIKFLGGYTEYEYCHSLISIPDEDFKIGDEIYFFYHCNMRQTFTYNKGIIKGVNIMKHDNLYTEYVIDSDGFSYSFTVQPHELSKTLIGIRNKIFNQKKYGYRKIDKDGNYV